MTTPSAESASAIDALVTAYNGGVNALNAAAREAGFQPG
jgi:hypothetical protein